MSSVGQAMGQTTAKSFGGVGLAGVASIVIFHVSALFRPTINYYK
jgi:hypothetical protein